MKASASARASKRVRRLSPDRLDRSAWIEAARRTLIEGGVAKVRVEPLAATLGVTTGSFYWHFKNRQELLSELLSNWETTNSLGLISAIEGRPGQPMKQMEALSDAWFNEHNFDPAYDSAVRDWARTSPAVDKVVRRVDEMRIALIRKIFIGLEYKDPEALVRARITYFHQVGYYALHIKEPRAERKKLIPYYERALLGPRAKDQGD